MKFEYLNIPFPHTIIHNYFSEEEVENIITEKNDIIINVNPLDLISENDLHHKNLIALKNYKNLNIKFINYIREIDDQDLNKIDCIYSPSEYFDYNKYKDYKIKFIFGPHFSVFPNINVINKNIFYVLLIIILEIFKEVGIFTFSLCSKPN